MNKTERVGHIDEENIVPSKEIVFRSADLLASVKSVLKDKVLSVSTKGRELIITLKSSYIIGITVEDEVYKIYNVSLEWADKTTYLCEKAEDNTCYYYLETIDECIGEIQRIVMFEEQKEKHDKANMFYEECLKMSGMNELDNWKGDPRERLLTLFNPLISNSEFEFKINTTDKSSKLLELYRKDETKRIMGISAKVREQQIGVFFNPYFYEEIKKTVDLPENQRKSKSQPHMTLPLYVIWNVLCVATGNVQFMVG